jgi:hypothetical protein
MQLSAWISVGFVGAVAITSHGCSSSSHASPDAAVDDVTFSATVDGTFFGSAMTPRDAFSVEALKASDGWSVVVADYTSLCQLSKTNVIEPGSSVLTFNFDGVGAPTTGTVEIAGLTAWNVQYERFDASCDDAAYNEPAMSGSFTISHIDSSGIVISAFDLMLQNRTGTDHVTGSVSAPTCTGSASTATPTCD